MAPIDDVSVASRAFYDAFEAHDVDAMSLVWEHSERVVCTHPGWRPLRGWGAVAASFFTLLTGSEELQFVLTHEQIVVCGDMAWVSVEENLLSHEGSGTVAAVNIFHYEEMARRWLLVCHHGSPVVDRRIETERVITIETDD